MERQVRIRSTQSNEISTHTLDVETFGDVQEALQEDWGNNTVIVRETKTTLDLKGAKLPDGDITLFVMPKKTKAGLTKTEVSDMGHSELRSASKDKGLPAVHVSSSEMRDNLNEWIDNNSNGSTKQEVINLLRDAIDKIESLEADTPNEYFEVIERDFERTRAELGI